MELNKFIDFKAMLKHLVEEHRTDLEKHRFEADYYDKLLKFIDVKVIDEFDTEHEECDFTNDSVSFVFGYSFNDANESNNQSTTANYHIIFNRVLNEFTVCEYEQG